MLCKTLKKKLMMQAAVLVAPMLLAGCSSVPDAVNPVEWYRSSVEYFSEDDAETAEAPQQSEEKSAEMTAKESPAPEMAKEEEKKISSGFVAAQTPSRQYAQPVMRQGEIVNALGEQKQVVSQEPPAPKAAPVTPVETIDVAQNTLNVAAPKSAPTPREMQNSRAGTQADNRSVSQVYADNLAQTRPTINHGAMSNSPVMELNSQPFETVVVSGSGVSRQGMGYAPQGGQQYASLNNVVQSDVSYSNGLSAGMAMEPTVVMQGQAQSLTQYNPSMFSGSFQVATIQFEIGSANLSGEDIRILKEVLNIHRQQGGIIRIVGHASSRTRDMAPQQHLKVNHAVSLSRADKVARQLLQMGMPGQNLYVGGVSDSDPLYQEVMPSGEAGNRRTEIFVDY
jgi:outer membrane protein OmpA-like peptidoglycan-associated protein